MGTDYAGLVGIILAALSLCAIFGYMIYRVHTYSGTGERAKLEQMCHESWYPDVERQEESRGHSPPTVSPRQKAELSRKPHKLYHPRTGFGADRGFQLSSQLQGSSSGGTERGRSPPAVPLPQPLLTKNRSNDPGQAFRATQRNFSRGPYAALDETGLKEVAPAPPPKDKPTNPQDDLGEINPYKIKESVSLVSLSTYVSRPQHVSNDDILFAPRTSPRAAGKNWI
ncbi:hypothetical protein B0A52_00936 [Exophiala mesophila]|uniref:Uncharacterized protein n=1 Tax=Exophiala mesophila TaxID=212818 RepID=A0A438NIM9_EXOME|nr:hypothetical protein B0A52_00936 [Exophiala mesophila]